MGFGLQCNITPFDRKLANPFSDVLAELHKWPELEVNKPRPADSILTYYPWPHTGPLNLANQLCSMCHLPVDDHERGRPVNALSRGWVTSTAFLFLF